MLDHTKVFQLPAFTTPPNIKQVTGLFGRTKALELEQNDPNFPKRYRIGERLTAWKTTELLDYIERYSVR